MSTCELSTNLSRISLLMIDGDEAVLRPHGLSVATYSLLRRLDCDRGQRAVDLARALLIDTSTMSRLLDRLAHAGLVARLADPGDRRAQRIILTERGRATRLAADHALNNSLARRLSALSADEQRQLAGLLAKLQSGLRDALDAR